MITDQQREARRSGVGASDVPALFGCDPFKSDGDVFASKVYELEHGKTSEAADAGNLLEPSVLAWAARSLGPLVENRTVRHETLPLAANLDAWAVDLSQPVEAKTSGILSPLREEWGDDGTDQVPDRVILQCHAAMMVTATDLCHVPALLGGRGFAMFAVKLNPVLAELIADRVVAFWADVIAGKPPKDSQPASLDVLKRIRRTPNKIVDIPATLAERYEAAKAAEKAAKVEAEAAQAAVLQALGDAECGHYAGGKFTYYEQTRKAYTVEAGSYRVLRHKTES